MSDLNCVASPLDFVFDMKVPNRLMVEYSGGEEERPKAIWTMCGGRMMLML